MQGLFQHWQVWALLSAAFAALTAIFAKVGITGINSDLATLLRTGVILAALAILVLATGQWQPLGQLPGKSLWFIVLSGLATGASWLCYFRALKLGDASRVAPLDKLSVVLVAIFAAVFLGERLATVQWAGVALIAAGAVLVAWKA
ncbi:MAG: EamA family transporter [Paracoccaceae bacterium]